MKRSVIFGAVSAMAMIASAQAANLSTPSIKEIAYTPPPYIWSGFYIGVNGGDAWNSGGVSVLGTECFEGWVQPKSTHGDLGGGFGGGQIGFNIQRDRLVFGLEADAQGADVRGSSRTDFDPWGRGFGTSSTQLDWFATIRARLGLVTYENWLVYITGGLAFGGIQDNLNQSFDKGLHTSAVSRDDVYAGYVIGAGLEYGFSPAWSVKLEYQYMDLGFTRLKQSDSSCHCDGSEFDSGHSFNTVRVGINYHLVPQYVPLK
jgi:outer membrane immunogenic protein